MSASKGWWYKYHYTCCYGLFLLLLQEPVLVGGKAAVANDGDADENARQRVTPSSPSFLFMLVDDIGWSDFGYQNGTALTPNIDKWAH